MSAPQLIELEQTLQHLIAEHERLLAQLNVHALAMKSMDLKSMDESARAQDATRQGIISLETKRRALVLQLARSHNKPGVIRLTDVATLYPQHGPALLKLRDRLRMVVGEAASRSHVSSKVATAVLGHLNTVVRILAGAVERAGLYTKDGVPRVASRLGVVDAVG